MLQKGEVVWAKYGPSPEGDLSYFEHYAGWDYANADMFQEAGPGPGSFDDYSHYVRWTISKVMELKEIHNAKGIVLGEIGSPVRESEYTRHVFVDKYGLTMEEAIVAFWQILFEETLGKVDGYVFWYPWEEYEGVESLIRHYYMDSEQSLEADVIGRFATAAEESIEGARAAVRELEEDPSLAPFAEKAREQLGIAEEKYAEKDYIMAKYFANRASAIQDEANPLGIVVDGNAADWTEKYTPIAVDEQGDVEDSGEDVKYLYVENDNKYLYIMVEFVESPTSDLVLFFDVNQDEQWDYYVRARRQDAYIERMTGDPEHPEFVTFLDYGYGDVVEVRIPLSEVGSPGMVGIQAASWSLERGEMSDTVNGPDWIVYALR